MKIRQSIIPEPAQIFLQELKRCNDNLEALTRSLGAEEGHLINGRALAAGHASTLDYVLSRALQSRIEWQLKISMMAEPEDRCDFCGSEQHGVEECTEVVFGMWERCGATALGL